MPRSTNKTGEFEQALRARRKTKIVLRLYVAGGTGTSMRALANLRAICNDYLRGRYKLEVIDVYLDAEALRRDQIVAVPTLVKLAPLPTRRIVGDLSNLNRVLTALNVKTEAGRHAAQTPRSNR
jgi:circadian clock protein KaiB